ncbi:MAG: divergent polysaccharide deacetylase family protein [Mariprofundaceae bacterium]|nr:divergent polysaccharide deacetylase family protein [Mariprofundaceae bacterium]
MARKRRPFWLYATLTVLLVVLGLTLWLGTKHNQQAQSFVASLPESPPVIYEDIQRLSALKVLEEAQKYERRMGSFHQGIALILDDVGYDLEALKRVLKLPYPMAISIIPNAPHAIRAAEMAHAAGRIVMLHLPMEPSNPKYSHQMDDAFLRVGMDRNDVRRIMLADLARIPYISGVNNHMGSRLTALETPMRWVMDICRERGLFFVDSRTSKDSVAAKLAREAGLTWGERRVFLDDSLRAEDMAASWRLAKRKMSHHIPVIVIAHPHEATLNFLETHVGTNDVRSILPLKRLLFAGHAAHVAENKALNMRQSVGSIHAENNTN